ncbi:hypothetical protein Rhal01_02304 [Rubritalea halochordaticola]|uniref:Uncharacterized protein n=1 Tax=Rubritalea halochordaticola TaxID=714537 RepID=A0ABP9V0D6_9BACT
MSNSGDKMDWVIVDGIGPFFRGYEKRRINWSKIPLAELPVKGKKAEVFWQEVRKDMAEFVERVKRDGYNTVTLDDVAHVTPHEAHEEKLAKRIDRLREEMKVLVAIIKAAGLRVLMTTDVLPMTGKMSSEFGNDRKQMMLYFEQLLESFLDDFSEVDGVILRLGEGDGKDVKGELHNELYVRTAREANEMLRLLVGAFESRGKVLICRTWTVGAYPIGDLIWHRKRIDELLKGVESDAFLLSLKYGESDFFRYLPLNRAFFRTEVKTIIEFQARREYEGAGEYPSFIGFDAEAYAEELRDQKNLVGVSVWVQTGGWHAFRRLSYLGEGSPWVELNSRVLLGIFNEGLSVKEAIALAVGHSRAATAERFLRLADEAVKKALYVEEYARQKWFFRRVRIPPLIHVYWDCVFLYHPVKKLLAHFVKGKNEAVQDGYQALENFPEMIELAEKLGWSTADVEFMRDSFGMFVKAREYYFGTYTEEMKRELLEAKAAYKAKYPRSVRHRYRIKTDFSQFGVSKQKIAVARRMFVRNKRGYRLIDHIVTLQLLGVIYRLFNKRYQRHLPKFVRKSAMGVDALFK